MRGPWIKVASTVAMAVGLMLAACSKDAPPEEPPESETPAAPAEPPAPPPAPEPTATEVPITADFEAEARSEIDADNYAEVLDALAAEIEGAGE